MYITKEIKKMIVEDEMIHTSYYNPHYDIDGTADELFLHARNGYVDYVPALKEIQDILRQEGKNDKAQKIGFMIDKEMEDEDLRYSIAQAKLDFLDGGACEIDDIPIDDDENYSLTVRQDFKDEVIVGIQRNADCDVTCFTIDFDEFLGMSQSEFENRINSAIYYMA